MHWMHSNVQISYTVDDCWLLTGSIWSRCLCEDDSHFDFHSSFNTIPISYTVWYATEWKNECLLHYFDAFSFNFFLFHEFFQPNLSLVIRWCVRVFFGCCCCFYNRIIFWFFLSSLFQIYFIVTPPPSLSFWLYLVSLSRHSNGSTSSYRTQMSEMHTVISLFCDAIIGGVCVWSFFSFVP